MPEDLITYITGTTAVTSLVGSSTAPRVHYSKIPQASELSHVWLRTSSDTEDRTLDAAGGLHEAFVDIECVASTESAAQSLADAVKDRLDGTSHTAIGNITAQGIFLSDKDDQYIPKSIDEDVGRSVVAFDLRMFYST